MISRVTTLLVVLAAAACTHARPLVAPIHLDTDTMSHAVRVLSVDSTGTVLRADPETPTDIELASTAVEPVMSAAPLAPSSIEKSVTASGTWSVRLGSDRWRHNYLAAPGQLGHLVMGRSSSVSPGTVETGNTVAMWALPNGSPVVNVAAGSERIGATRNSLDVHDAELIGQIKDLKFCVLVLAVLLWAALCCIDGRLKQLVNKS